jgi:hypothetical protein
MYLEIWEHIKNIGRKWANRVGPVKAEMVEKTRRLSRWRFSIAPMMDWTDRAEKQSVIRA